VRSGTWIKAIAAGGVAVALATAAYFAGKRTSSAPMPEYQRLTFMQGSVSGARFSPDGKNVVYAANWDGNPRHVYLAVPGNAESRDLGASDHTGLASVSGKGDIAYLAAPFGRDGSGTLVRGSMSGLLMRPLLEGVKSADYAPDGESIAVVRFVEGKYRIEYPIGKVLWQNDWAPLGLRVSPDGSRIAITHYHEGSSVGLSVLDREGKSRLLGVLWGEASTVDAAPLSWRPDGKEIWFRSYDPRAWGTLYAMDMNGTRRVVARFPGRVTLFDLAADGRALMTTESGRIGVFGLAPGETAERDLSVLDASLLKDIARDGSAIVLDVVGESGGPRGSVYLRKTDGSPAVRLGDGVAFRLSPDGRSVFGYTSKEASSRRYVLLPTGAGEEREVAVRGGEVKGAIIAAWLPDGRYLVFGSNAENKFQVFVWDERKNSVQPITPSGVADGLPLLSPDSREAIVLGGDRKWRVYPIAGGQARDIAGIDEQDTVVNWHADGKSVFVSRQAENYKSLEVSIVDIATGRRQPWKTLRAPRPVDHIGKLQMTFDGRAYAYNYQLEHTDLYIVSGLR
jgi:Tol biopolymer transport system component